MKLVVAHNYYQLVGGEDRVFADETRLLASHGHHVVSFTRHNDDVPGIRPWTLAARTVWNASAASDLERVVREHRAEIVHFHNILPLISPAAYYAAHRAGAAVVQTMHNYRYICPSGTFFRDGQPCESCMGKFVAWPAVRHACYRNSRPASAAITAMLAVHRARGTYQKQIDAYIALTQFSRDKLVAGGLPAKKVHVRPNYMLDDPGLGDGSGGYAIYLGRLSPEKGIPTLLEAWQKHDPGLPLTICGDGPLAPLVEQAVSRCERITWFPNRPHAELLQLLGKAAVLVLPAICYENFPKSIVEAYSKGTPVIASRLGAMAELVHENVTGACCDPGDPADLAATVRRTISNFERLSRMRAAARRVFESQYTAAAMHDRLMEIYDHALHVRRGQACSPIRPKVTDFGDSDNIDGLFNGPPNPHETEVCAP